MLAQQLRSQLQSYHKHERNEQIYTQNTRQNMAAMMMMMMTTTMTMRV
jgi:hypothetical protein